MKQKMGLTILLVVLVGTAIVLSASAIAEASLKFKAVPLSPANPDKVKNTVLDYTNTYMNVVSGRPKVIYTGEVIGSDLPSLGLSEIKSNHPLMLIIVEGDIDISNAGPGASRGNSRYNYINYVFDLKKGAPTLIVAEIKGNVLERVLNPEKRLKDTNTRRSHLPIADPLPDGEVEPPIELPDGEVEPPIERLDGIEVPTKP